MNRHQILRISISIFILISFLVTMYTAFELYSLSLKINLNSFAFVGFFLQLYYLIQFIHACREGLVRSKNKKGQNLNSLTFFTTFMFFLTIFFPLSIPLKASYDPTLAFALVASTITLVETLIYIRLLKTNSLIPIRHS